MGVGVGNCWLTARPIWASSAVCVLAFGCLWSSEDGTVVDGAWRSLARWPLRCRLLSSCTAVVLCVPCGEFAAAFVRAAVFFGMLYVRGRHPLRLRRSTVQCLVRVTEHVGPGACFFAETRVSCDDAVRHTCRTVGCRLRAVLPSRSALSPARLRTRSGFERGIRIRI